MRNANEDTRCPHVPGLISPVRSYRGKGPQTGTQYVDDSVTGTHAIHRYTQVVKGPQRSPNSTGDSVGTGVPELSPLVRMNIAKGPQSGCGSNAPGNSAAMRTEVPKGIGDAVTKSWVTASDNGDSVSVKILPGLGTFSPIKSVTRSPKVPKDAVTTVTTLSPKNSDNVSGRSGDLCHSKDGQRSPNSRAVQPGDLCPNLNRANCCGDGHLIKARVETLSLCHPFSGHPCAAVTLSPPYKKASIKTYIYVLIYAFPQVTPFWGGDASRGAGRRVTRVTASLGTFSRTRGPPTALVRKSPNPNPIPKGSPP